jgi:hypothetical protein
MVNPSKRSDNGSSVRGKLVIVLAGIVIGQGILYGPSLGGWRVLLPLDILTTPGCYTPESPEHSGRLPHNRQLSDLVLHYEPGRHYLGSELRSGRFPLWNPHEYAGAPDILPKFSPFVLLGALIASPKVLAWLEVLKAITGALGVYFFCLRVLQVGFWPATIAAWCYPLTGFFVLWQGYSTAAPVLWLPWLPLAVDGTIRRGGRLAPAGLAAVSGLVLTSGQLDVAGQVLLTSALFGLWCYLGCHGEQSLSRRALRGGATVILGWGLGFLLAAP